MTTRFLSIVALACPLLIGQLACGSSVPPRELEDARAAFTKAKAGPASELALAQLETAKQALQEAEAAFDDGDEERVLDLAYVAERRAQLADAAGALEQANRERAKALEEQTNAREEYQRATERELRDTRKTAEAERLARIEAEKRAREAMKSLEEMGKVKEEARGTVITLDGSVLFASGKYELLPIARSKLTDIATALKDQGFKKITIEGHTDSRGSETTNQQLSENRAMAVRNLFLSQGLDASKITAVGLGEARPVADNSTPEGRANNRRVEIIVQPE